MGLKGKYLDERFTTSVVNHPPLPFFHSSEAVNLQAIFDSGELQPRYCKVYEEELLYLFYGRPAYKSCSTTNSRLSFLMPVVFIINYDAIDEIRRAVAFDSGAFRLYAEHLHDNMKPEEFYLTPTKETLNKMVHYFFNGNDPYFHGEANKTLEFDSIHFQLEGYHSIITSTHKMGVDDRKASLEVQLDYSIPLTNKHIEAVILPKYLANSATIKGIMDSLQIPVITIKNYGVASRDYYVYILEKAKEYLVGKKLLNGN